MSLTDCGQDGACAIIERTVGADEVTERYMFNPSMRIELIRRRDELEQRNAEARREYMLRNRGLLLAQLLWCVPENDWKVAL